MNNTQIAQAWAKQSRPEARGSHFYFIGTTLYSYGPHFPVARHFKGAVLFTNRDYSNSTARHKSRALSAVLATGKPVFYVNNPTAEPDGRDVRDKAESIKESVAAIGRARDKQLKLETLGREVVSANEFCEHFGFSTRFDIPKDLADLVALAEKCKVFLGGEAGAYKLAKEMLTAA